MRVLRASCYTDPYEPPTIAVVRDCDVTDTLESIRVSSQLPGMFVTHDLFEVREGTDVPEATLIAGQRAGETREQEKHQAMLYFYFASNMEPLKTGGVLYSDRPAPLSPEAIEAVLDQLTRHPLYRGFRMSVPARDGTIVTVP